MNMIVLLVYVSSMLLLAAQNTCGMASVGPILCYSPTAGAAAASMRALERGLYSATAQLYSPLSPVAITPSRSSFL